MISWKKGGRSRNAVNAAKQRYNTKSYDQVNIHIKKGGRDTIQALAAEAKMSMAEYIRYCIIQDATLKGHNISERIEIG